MSRMVGTVSRGIRTPIIRSGDDLVEIVTNSLLEAAEEDGFSIRDRDIVAMTEAIVARAQGNYASVDDIAADVKAKLGGGTVGVIFPILSRNRFAIINDYMEEGMKPFRMLQYDYYRKGLDEMANNVERGRTEVTTALQQNLKQAHENKPLSLLPQIWTDYKKDELVNIYKGKGTQKEKESVYDILMGINASQSSSWNKIKQ